MESTPKMSREEFITEMRKKVEEALGRVADAINETLAPIQAQYMTIRGDEPWLLEMLAEGAERAAAVADTTLLRAQRAVGLR